MSVDRWVEPGSPTHGTTAHLKDLKKDSRGLSALSDYASGNESDDENYVQVKNPNIDKMEEDVLYHFALGTKSHDLKRMFGDVKFVCVGGSPRRMEGFATYMLNALGQSLPAGQALINIARATDRYALYKAGPVLAASHGIGVPSLSVALHEIIKILYHAGATDVNIFRLGTSGGVGLEPGTVVVSESAVDSLLRPELELAILGKLVHRPAILDKHLVTELTALARPDDSYKVVSGKTMCTLDFYEGQGRLDGAFCDYTEADKMAFLNNMYEKGVRNIEMESLCFAAMCHHAGIRGAVVCVTLLDRLKGDQINTPRDELHEWDNRPAEIVARLIRKRMGLKEYSKEGKASG